MSEVLAPRCPGCDSEPLFTWFVPWFCPDEACAVFTWDPYERPERFKANAVKIDLSGFREQP